MDDSRPDGQPQDTALLVSVAAEDELEAARAALAEKLGGQKGRKYARFVLAALGSIPWIGGFLGAAAALHSEVDQGRVNEMQRLWLQEHEGKLQKLARTLNQVLLRFEGFDEEIQQRIQSDDYLDLIRKGFRSWDQADTEEKRELIRKLLTNAGATKLCPDDLVRLFIAWIDSYHEAHFAVIREIYKNPGVTRAAIWEDIYGEQPREDSAEADLFKLLIRDLSTGGVVRQERPTNAYGQFVRRQSKRQRAPATVMKSAFDDEEPYVLTELGRQFVHYTMDEVVSRLGDATSS
jgi:hypothetical protein